MPCVLYLAVVLLNFLLTFFTSYFLLPTNDRGDAAPVDHGHGAQRRAPAAPGGRPDQHAAPHGEEEGRRQVNVHSTVLSVPKSVI